jgi:WD40 repeat protein
VGEDRASITRKAHTGEVYSLDFNKKSEHLLISGGEDGDVCFWDLRNMSKKVGGC